jgi:ParB-like chromosome segregation protein Spo0J
MAVQSEVAFAENFHRKDMSPIETASMLAEYKNRHKLSVEEIAKIAHKSRQWVERLLKIEDWPADVQMAVHKGQITVSAASNLASVGDKKYRLFLLRNAVEQGATARTTAAWLQEYNSRQPMEQAVRAEPADGIATSQSVVPQTPCFICSQTFAANEVSHIPVCGECVKILRKAGT